MAFWEESRCGCRSGGFVKFAFGDEPRDELPFIVRLFQ